MRFGSVCSGIEAASVAWHPLGWRAAWLAEIEPFPSAVLAHHYPDVPNLGDMSDLPERIVMGEVEAPDLFCGGTPCQAFSVAGLRQSLNDARGNLSLTFCEIANAIDISRAHDGHKPCIVFWENVPGVLNTKDNAFGCFLAGLAGEDEPLVPAGGKWPNAGFVFGPQRAVAWRVLDAQYFGVAQRRRRVFVVASSRDDFDPATVLFEFDGVRRDTAPSREAGEATAGGPAAGTGVGGAARSGVANTMTRSRSSTQSPNEDCTLIVCASLPVGVDFQNCADTGDLCGTLMGEAQKKAGQAGHGVLQPVAFHPTQDPISSTDGTTHAMGCGSAGGTATVAVAFSAKDYGADATADLAPTLRAMNHAESHANGGGQMAVAFAQNQRDEVRLMDVAGALAAEPGAKQQQTYLHQAMQVRRLTPVECERLQGFPDSYTAIAWRGKPADQCPDGPRYKALGNSWAVPVVRWIGWRIAAQVFGDLA